MLVRAASAIITCAALSLAVTSAPAVACISADAVDHHILPTLPKNIDADAVVLKVLLKKTPDWNTQRHDEAIVSVLGVVKGTFQGRSISLALRPRTSCDTVGVVGRPGYVVLKRYPSGWIVSGYHVVRGHTTGRGSVITPL
jgi:hypothetical protein